MSRTTKPQYLRNKVLFAVKNIRIKLLLTLLQKYIKFLRNLISLNNNALQLCYFLYCKEKHNTLKILYLLQSVSLTFKTKKAAEDPYFSLINNTIKIIVPKRFRTDGYQPKLSYSRILLTKTPECTSLEFQLGHVLVTRALMKEGNIYRQPIQSCGQKKLKRKDKIFKLTL